MVLKVAVQKEIPKQSHPKVTSEAALCRFQLAFTCSKLTIETLGPGKKYLQS